MSERWAVIDEFWDYEVSDQGRIRRVTSYGRGKAGTIRKLCLTLEGYPLVVGGVNYLESSTTVSVGTPAAAQSSSDAAAVNQHHALADTFLMVAA